MSESCGLSIIVRTDHPGGAVKSELETLVGNDYSDLGKNLESEQNQDNQVLKKKNNGSLTLVSEGRGQRERKAVNVLLRLVGYGRAEENGLWLPSVFDSIADIPAVRTMNSRIRDSDSRPPSQQLHGV